MSSGAPKTPALPVTPAEDAPAAAAVTEETEEALRKLESALGDDDDDDLNHGSASAGGSVRVGTTGSLTHVPMAAARSSSARPAVTVRAVRRSGRDSEPPTPLRQESTSASPSGSPSAAAVSVDGAFKLPTAPDRMIIVAGWWDGKTADPPRQFDLNWLLYYFSDHCITIMNHADADDPGMPHVLTPNVAREAPGYLRFILDHYDNLPSRMLFIHGHRGSWHDSGDTAVLIRHLRWDLDYANINLNARVRLSPDSVPFRYDYIKKVWGTIFQKYVGGIPPHLDIYMSAQFLVSRENVRALPYEFYEGYYNFTTDRRVSDPTGVFDADLSIVCEHLWTFIMNKQAYSFTDSFPSGEAELCANLDTCPIPSAPVMPSAVRAAVNGRGNGFYPCGAYPKAPSPAASPNATAPQPGPRRQLASVRGASGGGDGAAARALSAPPAGFGPHERWLHELSPVELAGQGR